MLPTAHVSNSSFFQHHGWLAPGIKLFRSIGFPAKAGWISAMFLIPLAFMLWVIWGNAQEQVDFTVSEQQGLAYVQPVLTLINAAQDLRSAATENKNLIEAQNNLKTAFGAVAQKQKDWGRAFNTDAGFNALHKAYSAVQQKPVAENIDATFLLHSELINAAVTLIGNIADGSQLSLDPELDTYHLMNISVLVGPQYTEQLSRIRRLGTLTLESQDAPTATRRRLTSDAVVLLKFMDDAIENSYQQGIVKFPEVAQTIDMQGVDAARETFLAAIEKQVLVETPQGDPAGLLALGRAVGDKQSKMNTQLMARLQTQLQARIDRLHHAFYRNLGLSVFFVLLAQYLMLAFYRVMMGGLREVASHLGEITQGNLTTAPTPWGSDEAAQLMVTLGNMQASLRKIAMGVRDGAGNVQTASEEIASVSQDLSQRTEANAASLEKTAAAMEQIASTVKHTSDTVQGATSIVRENAASATRGGEVIAQVVHTMENIRTSSNRIGEIIGVIDGIAFQTNILALNAAVEAARAGEQGRGFAVVASEVRSLAGRSAAAAKEIKGLISASIALVETGNEVVAEAGSTIQVIVANATRIDALMGEIAAATREQSLGVSEVGTAVNDLDQGTQQNAALVEETAAAAGALADQAQRLADDVAFFKFK
jgi:methyl-accepting chemotaxis protein